MQRRTLYDVRIIRSFCDEECRQLVLTGRHRALSAIARTAFGKLNLLESVQKLEAPRTPPGNHLGALLEVQDSTAFASTCRDVCVLDGMSEPHGMLKPLTITGGS